MNINKSIVILGSTGSVGKQTADVAEYFGVKVKAIAAGKNIKVLEEQIRKFSPEYCAVTDQNAAKNLKIAVADTSCKILDGYDSVCQIAGSVECDIVFNSVSGKNGLLPTVSALKSGRTVALANKESMVCAGDIVNDIARKCGGKLLPVDSEHCAIHQCLCNGRKDEVKRILLTASGGPFFGYTAEMLDNVTLKDALAHPTWNMGSKITIDSASLANKGLEIIEAMKLFDVECDQIDVIIHRQSIIHSMVEYKDNSVIAQLGVPDMRYPAKYALMYPQRVSGVVDPIDFCSLGSLTFDAPNEEVFKMLPLAKQVAKQGGVMPCAYNAANEIAVGLFLEEKIGFTDIYRIVNSVIGECKNIQAPTLDDILQTDSLVRNLALDLYNRKAWY